MATAAQARAAQAERDTAALLRKIGFRGADRAHGAGKRYDVGDIRGVPHTVIEVKAEKAFNPSTWLSEAEVERQNANADWGIVVAKRPGKGIQDGYFIMRAEDGLRLLKEAIYADNHLRKSLEALLENLIEE